MCSDVLLIELECKHCKLRFNICRKCYRGHVYCSNSCRRQAQLKARRKVQSRYRTSDKGRATHRCYEKMQRMSKTNRTMADTSTNTPPFACYLISNRAKYQTTLQFLRCLRQNCGCFSTPLVRVALS